MGDARWENLPAPSSSHLGARPLLTRGDRAHFFQARVGRALSQISKGAGRWPMSTGNGAPCCHLNAGTAEPPVHRNRLWTSTNSLYSSHHLAEFPGNHLDRHLDRAAEESASEMGQSNLLSCGSLKWRRAVFITRTWDGPFAAGTAPDCYLRHMPSSVGVWVRSTPWVAVPLGMRRTQPSLGDWAWELRQLPHQLIARRRGRQFC
jgi:hypothetical protein